MIGKEILNYRIIQFIGAGGMGAVYLAENKFISKQKVAVKVIKANMANSFTRQLLKDEAEKLAELNHPNIVASTTITLTRKETSTSSWNMPTAKTSTPISAM